MGNWSFERVDLGESRARAVVWDGRRLLVSLSGEGRIVALDPGHGTVEEWRRHTGGIGAMAFGPGGRLYCCQPRSRRVACLEPDGSASVPSERLEGEIHNHPRDVTVDPVGRVWFSDPVAPGVAPGFFPTLSHSSVLVLDPTPEGWQLRRATFDTMCPGALRCAPGGTMLYVVDDPTRGNGTRSELRAYAIWGGSDELEGALLGPGRTVWRPEGEGRTIHSLCVDDGGQVLAGLGGGAPVLAVVAPYGEVIEQLPAPGEVVGSALGGPAANDLYVITSLGELWCARDTVYRAWLPFVAREEAADGARA